MLCPLYEVNSDAGVLNILPGVLSILWLFLLYKLNSGGLATAQTFALLCKTISGPVSIVQKKQWWADTSQRLALLYKTISWAVPIVQNKQWWACHRPEVGSILQNNQWCCAHGI